MLIIYRMILTVSFTFFSFSVLASQPENGEEKPIIDPALKPVVNTEEVTKPVEDATVKAASTETEEEDSANAEEAPSGFVENRKAEVKASVAQLKMLEKYHEDLDKADLALLGLMGNIPALQFDHAKVLCDCAIQLIEKHYNGSDSVIMGLDFLKAVKESVAVSKSSLASAEKKNEASKMMHEKRNECKAELASFKKENRPGLRSKGVRQLQLTDQEKEEIMEKVNQDFPGLETFKQLVEKSFDSKMYQVGKPVTVGATFAFGHGYLLNYTKVLYKTSFGRAYLIPEYEFGVTGGGQVKVNLGEQETVGNYQRVRDLESSSYRFGIRAAFSGGILWGLTKRLNLFRANPDVVQGAGEKAGVVAKAGHFVGDDAHEAYDKLSKEGFVPAVKEAGKSINVDHFNIGGSAALSFPVEVRSKLPYDMTTIFQALKLHSDPDPVVAKDDGKKAKGKKV